jgi:uncharacterized protein
VYFEPVYVSQAAAGSSGAYPTLQGMLVYYNGQVGYAPTLQQALAKVFGAAPVPTSTGTTPPATSPGAPANATVLKYLQQAESYYSQAEAALKSGNFGAYGTDLSLMKTALDNATNAAQGSGHAAAPAPKPSATPSPSPSR